MAQILIVDDEEVLRDLLVQILETMGHRCDQARNGLEGCQRVASHEYDLIITDIRMPEMGGLDFLRRIEPYVESRTPCMIITALADEPQVAVKAVRLACDFLSKPFEMRTIQAAVVRALELREAWKFRKNYEEELERALVEKEHELQETYDGVLVSFASLMEEKDRNTSEHCLRVRDYCTRVAEEMGITDPEELRHLRLGAMLHDIGKFKVPDSILGKCGPLTPEEWVEMRKHPAHGADFVKNIPFLAGAWEVVQNHHERWDGGGYPRGLKGEEIPLSARIFFVVDAFDTICEWRCYKKAESPAVALERLRRNAGTQFDPAVVEAFERVYEDLVASQESVRHAARNGSNGAGGNGVGDNGKPVLAPSASDLASTLRRKAARATRLSVGGRHDRPKPGV